MIENLKEGALSISFVMGLICFFLGLLLYLDNIKHSTYNIQLEIFLIILMIIGASTAIGLMLLYFLYLEKRWYGD